MKICLPPISIMPPWLQVIARLNPLSYVVDGLRSLMLPGKVDTMNVSIDFAVLFVITTILVLLGSKLYPRIVQ
jgi:ABC-2 type transport system permease protein